MPATKHPFLYKNEELDMELIWNDLQNFGYLSIVSDGSVCYIFSISFGCILENPKGHWMTAASGPSMGWGSLICAEKDCILSGASFLSIIADKYLSKHCTIKYILDNFGMIKQNNKHLEYDIPYPNTTLRAEYDVIEQFYCLKKLHNIKSSFHWVKGHQDQTKNMYDLSIDAQLNDAADSYATKW